ncbi:SCO7613 C-terminal domain-containing membrane protein [Streptomyces zingiberis]|uniref:Integral membrane protein n=1 Tax=Streptomyces zingiberis TaxID=2053010 RepID=A0ABX1BYU6_9ACTN|nr:hypothetical protein [Streptomyces zingiberis]NJQ01488.1 hypothetical protein [Streptomyces zingiberis]
MEPPMEKAPPRGPGADAGPEAEIREIDHALARLEQDRARLLARRSVLLELLTRGGAPPVPPRVADGPRGAGPRPDTGPRAAARPETDAPAVRTVLLGLGGLLLAVAVTAFTVLSWGRLGIGGRSLVLGVLTAGALAAPVPLLRRSLAATAEVIACLGLLLLVLDAYALRRLAFPGADATACAALASAVLAVVWAGYARLLTARAPVGGRGPEGTAETGRAGAAGGGGPTAGRRRPPGVHPGVPTRGPAAAMAAAAMTSGEASDGTSADGARRMRLVPALALLPAQFTLVLWAAAVQAGPFGVAAALLGTAALDTAVLRLPGSAPRRTATVLGLLTGGPGLLGAVGLSLSATGPAGAARAALLLCGAAVLLRWAVRRPAAERAGAPAPPAPGTDSSSTPPPPAAAGGSHGSGASAPTPPVHPGMYAAPAAPGTTTGSGPRSTAPAPAASGPAPGTGTPGAVPGPRLPGPARDHPGDGVRDGTESVRGGGTGEGSGTRRAAGAPPAPSTAAPAAAAAAALSGLALVAAGGGILRVFLPGPLALAGYALCGALLPVVVRLFTRRAVGAGTLVAAALTQAAAVVAVAPATVAALLAPVGWLTAVGTGAPDGARAALAPGLSWPGTPAVPLVLAVAAAALATAGWLVSGSPAAGGPGPGWRGRGTLPAPRREGGPREGERRADGHQVTAPREGGGRADGGREGDPRQAGVRNAAAAGATALTAAAAAVLPVTLDLPYAVAVLLLAAQAAVALVAAGSVGSHVVSRTALACAVAVAVTAGCWGLAERPVTQGVAVALLSAFAVAALTSPAADRLRRPVTSSAAVVSAAVLVTAIGAGAGATAHRTAFAVLAMAAVAQGLAARVRRQPAGVPLEVTGAVVAVGALCLAATGPAAVLATALALAGVAAAGCALRPDRRRVAGAAATALLVLSAWVRLASLGVGAPEAYTLPVTVPALAVGLLRRRRDPGASSWTAYGPGLTVTLLPGLVAAWGDDGRTRPLLLGLAALALTLLGARRRLGAPLLLGGGVLALLALHELTPYLAQLAGAVPRWLPPALAGLVLLGTGATYERRLRDARRIRDLLHRLR